MHIPWLPPQHTLQGLVVSGEGAGIRICTCRLVSVLRSLWRLFPLLLTTTLSTAAEKEPRVPRLDAMVSVCLACHVLTGNSGDDPPALVMPESRFTAAMRAFRSGQRQGSVMNRIAAGYTEEDIQELARFLASGEARTR